MALTVSSFHFILSLVHILNTYTPEKIVIPVCIIYLQLIDSHSLLLFLQIYLFWIISNFAPLTQLWNIIIDTNWYKQTKRMATDNDHFSIFHSTKIIIKFKRWILYWWIQLKTHKTQHLPLNCFKQTNRITIKETNK